jgi:ribosome-associated translation inhibitor RaiA
MIKNSLDKLYMNFQHTTKKAVKLFAITILLCHLNMVALHQQATQSSFDQLTEALEKLEEDINKLKDISKSRTTQDDEALEDRIQNIKFIIAHLKSDTQE